VVLGEFWDERWYPAAAKQPNSRRRRPGPLTKDTKHDLLGCIVIDRFDDCQPRYTNRMLVALVWSISKKTTGIGVIDTVGLFGNNLVLQHFEQ
jgi:hypothetical protein